MGYELRDCIKSDNGNLYCFDCQIQKMVELKTTPIELNKLPLDVLEKLLLKRQNENKAMENA